MLLKYGTHLAAILSSQFCLRWALLLTWINFNPNMDENNHMPCKVSDRLTDRFPNLNGCTVEAWEWRSNFIPHLIKDVHVQRSLLGLRLIHVNKNGLGGIICWRWCVRAAVEAKETQSWTYSQRLNAIFQWYLSYQSRGHPGYFLGISRTYLRVNVFYQGVYRVSVRFPKLMTTFYLRHTSRTTLFWKRKAYIFTHLV